MRKTVAILMFDDVEVLDFAGPFEVFAVTDELRSHEAFNVVTVGLRPERPGQKTGSRSSRLTRSRIAPLPTSSSCRAASERALSSEMTYSWNGYGSRPARRRSR